MNAPPNVREPLCELGKALDRLGEALMRDAETDSLVLDATIQRFEFAVELCWKTLKKLLETEGEEAKTPRQALQKAYTVGWLDNEALWLAILNDRNLTSHTYKEDLAREIYAHIRQHYYGALRNLHQFLLSRYPAD